MKSQRILVGIGALALIPIAAAILLWPTPDPANAVSPGANGKIAFVSSRNGDGNREIYVMNADGSGQTRLTNNSVLDGSPAWSPDGSQIAFTSFPDMNFDIYVMNADGSGQTNLTNHPAGDMEPAWSPDGSKIAFTSSRSGNFDIYVMNADGSGQTNLTNHPASDQDPAWSPDGSQIAFSTYRDGNWEVYVMNADGSGQTNLSNNPEVDADPAWSPDGSQIAFRRYVVHNDIYVMNADGSGQTNLTDSPTTNDTHPAWSPDGSRIAFRSSRNGNVDVYVMNADGSGQTRLTDNPALDYGPDWQRLAAPEITPTPTATGQPTPGTPELTPTPTATAQPTPVTPGPTPASLPEMSLTVRGGDCDDPDQPTACSVSGESQFTLSVAVNGYPQGGYIGVQSQVVYAPLEYQPATKEEEIVWPDAVLFARYAQEGVIEHGALTSDRPTFPVSTHVGDIVQVHLICASSGSYQVVLPVNTETNLLGTAFLDPAGVMVAPETVGERLVPEIDPVNPVPVAATLDINCMPPAPTATAQPIVDTDSDGCSNARESGPDPSQGGLRNPLNFWDFGDMPDPAATPRRDRTIQIGDVIRVVSRYGTDDASGTATINRNTDPLSPPPETGYHPAYDRGGQVGPNPWDQAPADGSINIGDIVAVLGQYGHDCR